MSITATRLDGQNIGLRLTGGSLSANIFTVNLLTGEATSTYLTSVDLSIVQSAAVALFQTVPAGERATVTFLTRLVTVAPADDNTITLSISTAGNLATLVATEAATPASMVVHIQHSISGYVAWGIGFATGGGPPPTPSNSTFTANCLAGDVVGACVYITGPEVAGTVQVATADPSDDAKMPAVGIITAKAAPTTCTVQRIALADLTGSAVTLTPGRPAWVGLAGLPVSTPPLASLSPSGHVLLQQLGVAADAQVLEVIVGAAILRDTV